MLNTMRIVSRAAVRWMAERQQHRTVRELERLDDRLLADIGLRRSEIESLIRHGAGHGGAQRRRELIARSSLAIMGAKRRVLAARPLTCPVLLALVLIGVLLSAVVAAGTHACPAEPIGLAWFVAGGPNHSWSGE
jgi:uncharacterized protein YjiS (DUF1127 family)